jgi:hypothetical protein
MSASDSPYNALKLSSISSSLQLRFDAIAADIHEAELAKQFDVQIGEQVELINSKGFGHVFGNMQGIYRRHMILCLFKIFEQQNKRYLLSSIPATLHFLHENAVAFDDSRSDALRHALGNSQRGQTKEPLQAGDLTRELCDEFQKELSEVEVGSVIHALKQWRDKVIAHAEVCDATALDTATYEQVDELLRLAQKFLIDFGPAFLVTGYHDVDGKYNHSKSIDHTAKVFGRVIAAGMRLEVERRKT